MVNGRNVDVEVGSGIRTYAINALARVARVSVFAKSIFALDDCEGRLWNELVEGVWGAGELFAGIAVTIIHHELQFTEIYQCWRHTTRYDSAAQASSQPSTRHFHSGTFRCR